MGGLVADRGSWLAVALALAAGVACSDDGRSSAASLTPGAADGGGSPGDLPGDEDPADASAGEEGEGEAPPDAEAGGEGEGESDACPDVPVGAACTDDADCGAGGECFDWLPAGFCSLNTEVGCCPDGAAAYEFEEGTYCLTSCESDDDCRTDDGYYCADDDSCWADDEPADLPGDLGHPCDYDAETNDCEFACYYLDEDVAICVTACEEDADCGGDPYACNELPEEWGWGSVCLPNAECGDLPYTGACDGSLLSYCGDEGILELECSDYEGDNGEPLMCALVSEDFGYDCVSTSHSQGCAGERLEGRCDGDVLVYCQSQESGVVRRVDCTDDGRECRLGPDGFAECISEGAAGCGRTTERGRCDGATAVWCDEEAEEVVRDECDDDEVCGLGDGDLVRCIPWVADGRFSARGTFTFEKIPLDEFGYGEAYDEPIRFAAVQVLRESDDSVIAVGSTNEAGAYRVGFDADDGERVYVVVLAAIASDRHAVTVRDCPWCHWDDQGNTYGIATQAFAAEEQTDVGNYGATAGRDGIAGAFNVFDVLLRGFDFATDQFGRRPPPLTAQWAPGEDTVCGTSCADIRTIWVEGLEEDSDHYDDPVLAHEFGHFVETAFSRSDHPGGDHDGSATNPTLAWSEGFGTYFGAELLDSPLYLDGSPAGVSWIQVDEIVPALLDDPRRMRQLVSEYTVHSILWRLSRGTRRTEPVGVRTVLDVLGSYFVSGEHFDDRGVRGVDLVDFLDGLGCRGGVDEYEDVVDAIVVDSHEFPYDFNGPRACR